MVIAHTVARCALSKKSLRFIADAPVFDFSEGWIYVLGVAIAGAKTPKVGGRGLSRGTPIPAQS
jgi:hypothetical protein